MWLLSSPCSCAVLLAGTRCGKAAVTDLDLRREQRFTWPALAQPVDVHDLTAEPRMQEGSQSPPLPDQGLTHTVQFWFN